MKYYKHTFLIYTIVLNANHIYIHIHLICDASRKVLAWHYFCVSEDVSKLFKVNNFFFDGQTNMLYFSRRKILTTLSLEEKSFHSGGLKLLGLYAGRAFNTNETSCMSYLWIRRSNKPIMTSVLISYILLSCFVKSEKTLETTSEMFQKVEAYFYVERHQCLTGRTSPRTCSLPLRLAQGSLWRTQHN